MDIEIYIQDINAEEIIEWITSILGPVSIVYQDEDMSILQSASGSARIPITITNNVQGRLKGVWFNSPVTPWGCDLECARQAARDLKHIVFCAVPEDDP